MKIDLVLEEKTEDGRRERERRDEASFFIGCGALAAHYRARFPCVAPELSDLISAPRSC